MRLLSAAGASGGDVATPACALRSHPCGRVLFVFSRHQNLFTQLSYATEENVPPVAVRTALSILHRKEVRLESTAPKPRRGPMLTWRAEPSRAGVQSRFQLRQMDDATECLDAILTHIHRTLSPPPGDSNDACAPTCAAHE